MFYVAYLLDLGMPAGVLIEIRMQLTSEYSCTESLVHIWIHVCTPDIAVELPERNGRKGWAFWSHVRVVVVLLLLLDKN